MSYLGQSVHNYPNEIISILSHRQTDDEIHNNLFPHPLGDLQGLKQSSRSLILALDSLTGVTKGNISLHPMPPIGCLEIMVHLIPHLMNGTSGLVSLLKYLVLQCDTPSVILAAIVFYIISIV
jgi:hypothetical protein